MRKFLSLTLILVSIVVIGYVGAQKLLRRENPEINYLLPKDFAGVVIAHGSNTVVHPTDGRRVFVRIDSKGHGTINRKYITEWHGTRFSAGTQSISYWIEREYPSDTMRRAFSITDLNLKLMPADTSDAYFVGTGSQFKEFLRTHPED